MSNHPTYCIHFLCSKILEILLIFCVFFIYGAWTVPDVNEAHYLCKAAHYWNPNYCPGDFFLSSPNAHTPFFFCFGWLTLFFSLETVAWTGRILCWFLMAVAWERISHTLLPKWGTALLTATLFTCLTQYGAIAGEWVIGGVEGKTFAYVFVFFALAELLKNHWNRAWILLGLATMFHIVVGGWVIVATALTWVFLTRWEQNLPSEQKTAPRFLNMFPALILSFLFTLPALIPALMMDSGSSAEQISQANEILVFKRLNHHLLLSSIIQNEKMKPLLYCFAAMIVAWNYFCCRPRYSDSDFRLRIFVYAVLTIFVAGWAINLLMTVSPELAASLLKYYFFRLTDIMLPLGCAFLAVQMCIFPPPKEKELSASPTQKQKEAFSRKRKSINQKTGSVAPTFRQRKKLIEQPGVRKFILAILIMTATLQVYQSGRRVLTPRAPRSCGAASDYWPWRDVCEKVRQNTVPGTTFMMPYNYRTFTWFSERNVVAVWKDMPQDAEHLVEWWNRISSQYYGLIENEYGITIYGRIKKFADTPYDRFSQIAKKYGAVYVIARKGEVDFYPRVYQNDVFTVWRIDGKIEAMWE
ncbi:MAG: hypothetical protein Q4C96_06685 [Planctomycetia bacterium]|nr:hypothetical protein [Planctomycetia bacterium]